MKPKFGTKVWHNRHWQLSPDQDLILSLNSVRDAESFINLWNGSPNLCVSKVNGFWAICHSSDSRKRKVVRVPQIILTFLLTKNLSHKSWIQAIFGLIHVHHEMLQVSLVHGY